MSKRNLFEELEQGLAEVTGEGTTLALQPVDSTSITKVGRPKKPVRVKGDKTVVDFVCTKISQGMDLTTVCKTYHKTGQAPCEPKYFREIINRNPLWVQQYKTAREDQIYCLIDEMNSMSLAPIAHAGGMSKQEYSALEAHRRLRMDFLKFTLAKLAPKYVPELADKLAIEHSNPPTFNIMSYALPPSSNILGADMRDADIIDIN